MSISSGNLPNFPLNVEFGAFLWTPKMYFEKDILSCSHINLAKAVRNVSFVLPVNRDSSLRTHIGIQGLLADQKALNRYMALGQIHISIFLV